MSVFIPIAKKGKEYSNYHTIVLISHASKVMLKILQVRHQQYINQELPDVQDGFRKGRGRSKRNQIATYAGLQKKQEDSRKTSTSDSLTMLKPLTVYLTTNRKILKEMGIPDHFTCFLRNLYASQQASQKQTWNNGLVPNWERSMSRLHIVTLFI